MLNLLIATTLLIGAVQAKPVVLKGLDPVLLIQGKEVKGSQANSADFGNFKYLFASQEDKDKFMQSPSAYAVQNNGDCGLMPRSGGNPDIYFVHNHKIYLMACMDCLAAAKANPDAVGKPSDNKHTVAIFIFPGAEIIDYAGPWEVFGGAGFDVFTVAATGGSFRSSMGQTLTPDYTFENCPPAEILLLPGGAVSRLPKDDPTIKWIQEKSKQSAYTMSVCNGAFWLADAGLLDGKSATTIKHRIPQLTQQFPNVKVLSDQRFVDNGTIITTAGLSAGIDGALHMVSKILGEDAAQQVATGLEYQGKWEK